MKKKILIGIIMIITIIVLFFGAKYLYNESLKDFTVEKENNIFQYTYVENFTEGNSWSLYINDNYAYSIYTFTGYSIKDMKEHLTRPKLIRILVNEGKIQAYALPLEEYESKYTILYTVDGENYWNWAKDVSDIENYGEDEYVKQAKQDLAKLYEYISEDELKKISEETWE